MEERRAIIALHRVKGLDHAQKRQLLEGSDSLVPFFAGKTALKDPVITKNLSTFKGWEDIDRDLKILNGMGVDIVTIRDNEYPLQLRNIPDAPLVLYRMGRLDIGANTIAIVGSRRATYESLNMAEKIAQTLSSLGVTVVSGLARGVDAAAHTGALKEGGSTVAVLGCGIDICYPSENRGLFDRIGDQGAILTEYDLGEKPLRHHFPERNRIIAGLSKGVLVVEASQRSGSLITARLGLEYGREVMAVPGSIFDEEHKGANSLIKQGARLVDGIEDILSTCFPNLTFQEDKRVDLTENERYIYALVGSNKVHVDEVIGQSAMETKHVMAILTSLEIKEIIRSVPGGYYLRR